MATNRKYTRSSTLLGRGAYGKVFLASDDEGTQYAMKVMMNVSLAAETVNEVKALKKVCSHESIVKYIDAYKEDDDLVIILEYCELGCLDDYIDVNKTLAEKYRDTFMLDIAKGVQHLHEQGIAHRDLKPANVLLVKGEGDIPTCKLTDFGFAKIKDEIASSFDMKTWCGTPLFMAPEIKEGSYKKSCDVFSLGVIFYVLYTLRTYPVADNKAFCVAGTEEVQRAVDVAITSKLHADLVSKMLRFNAEERPGAENIVQALSD